MTLFAGAMVANAQTSSLWGTDGELWSAAGRLQDYSWAGYRSSSVRLPVVPEVARLTAADKPTPTTDIAGRLQALINTVPSPGAIVIPAGRWYINKRVYLNRTGIVLRGEDGAELYEPQSLSEIDGVDPTTTQAYSNGPGFIVVGGGRSTTQRAAITADAAKGAASLTVSTTTGLAVGDMIMITQSDAADKSLAKHMHGGLSECGVDTYANNSDYPQMIEWFTRVKAISGNTLTTEMAVPVEIRAAWTPLVHEVNLSGWVNEVGVENLTIRAKGTTKNAHLQEAGWNGIQFNKVINGWVKDVTFIDTDAGVVIGNSTSFCTFSGVTTKGDFRTVANSPGGVVGHHAIWVTGGSSFNLVTGCNIVLPFTHDLTCEGSAHHNVFMRSRGAKLNFDHHRNFPWGNLFTDLDVGDGSRIWESGGRSDRGPHAARELTTWGVRKSSGTFAAIPSTDVTTPTGGLGWSFLNVVGLNGLTTKPSGRTDQFLELGSGPAVSPANLFDAQWKRRQPVVPTNTLTLDAVADTYVHDSTANASVNYGNATTLVVKTSSTGYNREAFLRFNIPALGGTLLGGVLRLTPLSTSTPGVHGVFAMSDNTWLESGAGGVTWNTKPAMRSVLSVWTPAAGTRLDADVFQAIPSSGLVSFGIDAITQTSDGFVTYGSSENSTVSNRPQLILTFRNEAPTLSAFSNQTINQDAATAAIPFTIGDEFTAPGSLAVNGVSSNTTLVPNDNILFGGAGTSRTVTVIPAPNQTGVATIALTVGDGGLTTSRIFTVTVNGRPTISPIADLVTKAGTSTAPIPFTIGDDFNLPGSLGISSSSSDPSLVPNANVVIGHPWTSTDIGIVGAAGSSTIGDTITMAASGADIYNTADGGRFVHQSMTGDCEIIARVTSLQNTQINAKAGVMMRTDTTAGSANAYLHVTATQGIEFTRRLSAGATTSSTKIAGISAPCWVRLVKTGTSFSGYYATASAPTSWIQVGPTVGIPAIGTKFLWGLAATSHNDGVLGISTYDSISGPANRAVTITPAANRLGSATLTLNVSDGDLTASRTFVLTVTGDGAQTWRYTYFGTTANTGTAADTFDANGDGESNFLEFATGQDPSAASITSTPVVRKGGNIEFSYTRSNSAMADGIAFEVEWSDTLDPDSWSTAGVSEQIPIDNGTVQTVMATVPAGSGGKRFVRLNVTRP